MSERAVLMSLSCRVIMSVSTSFCRMILLPVLPMSTPCAAVLNVRRRRRVAVDIMLLRDSSSLKDYVEKFELVQ